MDASNRPNDQQSNTFDNSAPPAEWWRTRSPVESNDERNDLTNKQRRYTMHASPHSVTLPIGETGQRQSRKQHQQTEYGADLAMHYTPISGTDSRPRSRTVLGPGGLEAGQSVATTVPVSIAKMRQSRRPSNSAAVSTSPLMNQNPLPSSSSSTNNATGRFSASRPKRRTQTDAPRHIRRSSRSSSMLMAATASHPQLGMETDQMWNPPPLFNSGRRMTGYPANMVMSETPVGHTTYSFDRSHINYQPTLPEVAHAGFTASGVTSPSGRLPQGLDAGMSPYHPPRSSLGLAGTLSQSPASTLPDRHLEAHTYSQNLQADTYGNVSTVPGYPAPDNYGFTHLGHQPSVDPMSNHLQQQAQHTEHNMYGPDSQGRFYQSSQSPVSPRMPIRSSPQQALYQPYPTAPNITVTNMGPYPGTVEEIVKLNQQVSYLPQTSFHHLQSPLPALSPPSEMSEPEQRHSPTLQNRSRVPGQRVDVDSKMLESSFRGNDIHSRVRREVLDDIQRQTWFHHNQDEPKMDANAHREILQHGLGMVGRSIYTVFLVEDKESNQWRCLFGNNNQLCKKSGKRFERVERAIEHVRSHLGHRPYGCDGTCHKARSTGTICGKRFFAAGYLEDHKKRPQKRANNQ